MKRKLSAILAICMLSVTMTACGGGKTPDKTIVETQTTTTAKTTAAAETTTAAKTETEAETEETKAETENSFTDDFELLDVTADMIELGVYASDDLI